MKKYVLFDAILDINHTLPIVTSSKELLKVLNIDIPILSGTKRDSGVESAGEDMIKFYTDHAKTLALASREQSDIVCIDDSSFLSLSTTLDIMKNNKEINSIVISKLKDEKLDINLEIKILTLADFIIKEFGLSKLKKSIKNSFDKFQASLYLGSYGCQLKNYSDTESHLKLLKATGLQLIEYDLKNQVCGYEILDTNEELSFRMAGALMLDMFDNAADFVVVNDSKSFIMFDEHQKELEKAVGREIGLSVFCLSEILLLALGITDKNRIGLNEHAVKIDIV